MAFPRHLTSVSSAVVVLLLMHSVFAQTGSRQPTSPQYQGRDVCPERCSVSGPQAGNWSVYHNLGQIQACPQTMFYDFSLHDDVDDEDALHRIYACSSFGPDWNNLLNSSTSAVPAQTVTGTYEIGQWPNTTESGVLAGSEIRTLSKQMRQYLASGFGATNKTVILFGRSGRASIGLYIGSGLQNEGTGTFAMQVFQDNIHTLRSQGGSLAMQLCQPGDDGDHIFGIVATSNTGFGPVQNALASWSNAECLSLAGGKKVTGPAFLITPAIISSNTTESNSTMALWNSTTAALGRRTTLLASRSDCRTIQVASGDSCASLATKCGVSGADFTKYNPSSTFCSTLQPLQHVCCSSGTLPDFTPKPNSDGSCATYTVQTNDNCYGIAAANGLTLDSLTNFNKNTWAFNGCANMWVGTIICLSTGTPPMPAPVANAVCGPQVPGTKAPPAGTDISTLDPCPLNACCDVWGQCGTTAEFCTDTGTGAPGTARPGTNGCISNCGTNIVRSAAPAVFRSVAYFEGFGLGRPCLYQDALQLDPSKYTHVHFAFATLTADYQVQVGDALTTYEFNNFKQIHGPARIVSFGGWDFSTNPSTYNIFRQGVTAANRLTLATNIANFVKANGLDGVDIDWEYPGAPDIPGIPAADPADGNNYLAFLVILKNLLPGKSVSIAAPASYWYLKGFPIAKMSKIVDYIIFMTYDLHGQWDAGNQWSQPGCSTGMCLRSGVNLTETINALVMITKAGVASNQVVVGVSSYGRSFEMAAAGCYTENCQYTGSAGQSNAQMGPCTGVAGYISDAEIKDIIKSGNVNQNYVDGQSNTNILVYNDRQWISWMSPDVKASRKTVYQSLAMGGTSDWASDLEDYTQPPAGNSWTDFIFNIKIGYDPYAQRGNRTGNWTSVTCTDRAVEDQTGLTADQRWSMLDGSDAWADAINAYKTLDRPHARVFSESICDTIHGPPNVDCGRVDEGSSCVQTIQCYTGTGTGAVAYEIFNSMVGVHNMYTRFYNSMFRAASGQIDNAFKDFENKFAPVPKPDDDVWLQILLDLIGLGAAVVAAPFFSLYLARLPYFAMRSGQVDGLKDTTFAAIAGGISIAKDLSQGKGDNGIMTIEKQDTFTNLMGQVITAWANITERALADLFSGHDDSIQTLTTLISDGKMIEGMEPDGINPDDHSDSDIALQNSLARAIFAFAIPAIWSVSGVFPVVLDSGYPCGTTDPLGEYLSADTMHATWDCYQDKLYYLATPKGDAESCPASDEDTHCSGNFFSAPSGLDSLDGSRFGGVTVAMLIQGAVKTYIANGNQNGGGLADPLAGGTADDLFAQDITTPGFIRIPVCSPDMAYKAWDNAGGPRTDLPNYPCVPPSSPNDCGDSTFVDQTSDASPPVSDCMQIVKNIQGTNGEWEVENVAGNQHQLVQFGECKFGVQTNKKGNGNVDFNVGAQDIIDLITESVKRFGGGGKVGAKGSMSCQGTVKGQGVDWGLY